MIIFAARPDHPGHVVPAVPARRRRARWASRCSSTCATGSSARADPRSCPTAGTPSRRCARPAARRSPATSSSPPVARDGTRLEVVVVDVSGKGEQAGTRSLLLSGAFGGLLSALPPAEFLPAANDYLLRQDWEEGFATAIHLHLDLATGDFEIRTAGHPPAVQLHAGSGPLVGARLRGPDPRPDRRTPSSRACAGRLAAATRCCSTPTAWSRPPQRDIGARHRQAARPGRAAAARRLRGRRRAAGRRAGLARTTTGRWSWSTGAERRRPRPRSVGRRGGAVARSNPRAVWQQGSPLSCIRVRGCSSMVEPQSSKLITRVRFPSSAPSRVLRRRRTGPTWRGVA